MAERTAARPKNVVNLDFSNAPPAQGRTRDKIPPGKYLLTINRAALTEAKSTKRPMIVVNFVVARGEYTGKKLMHQFTLPMRSDAEPKLYGVQQFHALLIACGFKPPAKGSFPFKLDTLPGKRCMVDVSDNSYKNAQGQEFVNSQIDEFLAPSAVAVAASTVEDDENEEDEEDEDLDLDEDDDEEAEDDDSDDEDETDDEDEEEAEDDEEEPAPPPTPRASRNGNGRTGRATPVAEPVAAAAPARTRGRRQRAQAPAQDEDDFPFDN